MTEDMHVVMMPPEGRNRVVIEDVQPIVDAGRFPCKQIVGDAVEVTAAIFADGHDHLAARVLYRRDDEVHWRYSKMYPAGNDQWKGSFIVDGIGLWHFKIQGWVDHFDTWAHNLEKRIAAQLLSSRNSIESTMPFTSAQPDAEIQLALRTGAEILHKASIEIGGAKAERLQDLTRHFQKLAERKTVYEQTPVTDEIRKVVEEYSAVSFGTESMDFPIRADRERARFSTWYECFPRSAGAMGEHGTFRDLIQLLPNIVEAGFDVLYLPPIHPIGISYRKGKNNRVVADPEDVGSPWAIGNRQGGHTAIATELGGFDDFDDLIEAASFHKVEVALDIAFQCSPDHPWVTSHPDWFVIRPDGSIQYAENPPKKYQDIYPLNFESNDWHNLWQELSNVFLFWIKRDIRIFRVDNPHTKALPFWEWCISNIQRSFPDVIFLSEAFTRPHLMYGLAKRGFTQSYTYFTWRTTKEELTTYLQEVTAKPVSRFFRANLWPNTPDILPIMLQTGGRPAFVQRAILAATLTANYGIYGPAYELMDCRPLREGAEEYADSEKYQLRAWNRNREDSLLPLFKVLNEARRHHASLQRDDTLHFHDIDNTMLICYSKRAETDVILVVVNLDTSNVQSGWTALAMTPLGLAQNAEFDCEDLLTGHSYRWTGERNYVMLDPHRSPAHVFHITYRTQTNERQA